jgi:hypothetical protein
MVLEFLRLSETPVDDIATALAFLSAACGQGHTVCATVIHTGFHHCTRLLFRLPSFLSLPKSNSKWHSKFIPIW